MKVSIVIPTYKRENSLIQLLESIDAQIMKPDEVLVVVPFDTPFNEEIVHRFQQNLNISLHHSTLGVCFQRNKGIQEAKGEYVLLCDDDLQLERNYISELTDYLDKHEQVKICSGQYLDRISNSWSSSFPPKNWLSLFFKKFFCHGLWTSLQDIQGLQGPKFIVNYLHSFYESRGNTFTKAGWPLFVDQNKNEVKTKFYSLGASLNRKQFLIDNPFDEVLDPSGIGDNYGLALQLDNDMGIVVLNSTKAYHHRSPDNRIQNAVAYKRRVLAMNYFHKKFPDRISIEKKYLIWSVFGNSMTQLLNFRFKMVKAAYSTLFYLMINKNPYLEYASKGLKSCRI